MHIHFTPTTAVTIGSSDKISAKLGLQKNSGISNTSICMTPRATYSPRDIGIYFANVGIKFRYVGSNIRYFHCWYKL